MTEEKTLAKPPKLYQAITMARAKKLSQELNKFLKDNSLVMEIAGKNYIPVEGWQFTGMQMGLTEVVVSCDPTDIMEDEIKYKAQVEIINQHGTVVSRGFAWCSNKEKKKEDFEEYAIASMAQTRAIGKAYRNILAWVVKMGGYEATPYEEVDKDKMEDELSKVKQKVKKKFNDAGTTDFQTMITVIEDTIGKPTIDTVDDGYLILEKLESADG